MKEETREDLDKKFAQEQELSFWERIFEASALAMMHSTDADTRQRTYADIAFEAGVMAGAGVEERRKFLKKQK